MSETHKWHVSKSVNISKTKRGIEKLKTGARERALSSSRNVVLLHLQLDERFFS